MRELSVGQILCERFTLIRSLGRGGMAEVWLARDEELDQEVVLKLLPRDAPTDRVELMRRECRNARRLVHRDIVRVFDFHRDGGYSFISMEHVEGPDLSGLRGAPPAEIVALLLPVAEALVYAHGLGIVHRDLKAANVLVGPSGRPRLLDFGIAGSLDDEEETRLRGGGTRYCVSPQQLDGDDPAPADDLYAFGVLLYELIEGQPPSRSEMPSPPRSAHPLPQRLLDLVTALLANEPGDRPPDMSVVRDELAAIDGEMNEGTLPPRSEPGRAVRLTPPPRIEPIRPATPPRLDRETDPRAHEPQRRRSRAAITIGLAAVVTLIVLGVYWISPWRADPSPVAGTPEIAAPTPPAEVTAGDTGPAPSSRRRGRAEKALGRAMELAESLEARGAHRWAQEEYDAIEALLDRGDTHLTAAEYAEAEQAYDDAARALDDLDARAHQVLQEMLAVGQRALDDGDAAGATAAFELAATIQPSNRTAEASLRRAAVLDDLMQLLADGAIAENRGELERAASIYGEAVGLDPLSQTAQQALERTQGRIGDDAFRETMTRGVSALHDGEYRVAIEAFRQAGGLRPGSPEVAGALVQAEEGLRLQAVASLQRDAAELEAAERWRAAAEQYAEVLELDSTIRFAQDGYTRCDARADLAGRIEFHLTHPDRLIDDGAYAEAADLLDEAREIGPAGPRHREQIAGLDALLDAKGSRVAVRFESDEKTEVTVYRVGQLGRFSLRELELRPGTYTVVGTRRGYRDVRLELVVAAGAPPQPLVVRCVDKI